MKALDKATISPFGGNKAPNMGIPALWWQIMERCSPMEENWKRIQDFHDKGSLYSLLRGDRGIANEMKARR